MKSIIIVAGMHRSGTSAITRFLSFCGAKLPASLMQPVKGDNDLGFWESQVLMEFHDDILSLHNSSWDSLRTIPSAWFSSPEAEPFKERLKELIVSEIGQFEVAVIKDPRICKLVPLWLIALEEIGIKPHFTISLRNPLEVAQSLVKRNGFELSYALTLWFIHLRTLENQTRGVSRVFIKYEDLLEDPRKIASRLSDKLPAMLDWHCESAMKRADDFLDRTLRHHEICTEDFMSNQSVPEAIKHLYSWLENCAMANSSDVENSSALNIDVVLNRTRNTEFTKVVSDLDASFLQFNSLYGRLSQQVIVIKSKDTVIENAKEQTQQISEVLSREIRMLTDGVADLVADQELKTHKIESLEKQLIESGDDIQCLSEEAKINQETITQLEYIDAENQATLAKLRYDYEELGYAHSVKQRELAELLEEYKTVSVRQEEQQFLLEEKDKLLSEQGRLQKEREEIFSNEQNQLNKLMIETKKSANEIQQKLITENKRINKLLNDSDSSLQGVLGSSAWKFGSTVLSSVRRFRISWVGQVLLFVKALLSINLRNYVRMKQRMNIVRESGLFDSEYYLELYPLIKYSIKSPLEHYLGHGEREGRLPNSGFNPSYYQRHLEGIENKWHSSLVHYIKEGALTNFDPNPNFSNLLYRKKFCLENDINPLAHYLNSQYDAIFPERTQIEPELGQPETVNDVAITKLGLEIGQLVRHLNFKTTEEKVSGLDFSNCRGPIEGKVSIIIPFYNKFDYTVNCLFELSKQSYKNYEVILVDDASDDIGCRAFEKIEGLTVIRNRKNQGYLRSCNLAANQCNGEFILQLNNDTLPLQGWLENLVKTFDYYPKAGIVGSLMLDKNGLVQEAGGLIFSDASGYNYGRGRSPEESKFKYCRQVDFCSGASIIIKRYLWDAVGGYDDLYAPAYYEDADMAMAAAMREYEVIFNPFSRIVHYEGISSGNDLNKGIKKYQNINKQKFYNKWRKQLSRKPEVPLAEEVDLYVRNQAPKGQILWIDSNTPTPDKDAGSIETVHFFEQALKDGWGITFFAWDAFRDEGRYTDDLRYMGVECVHVTAHKWNTPLEYLHATCDKFDVIVLSRATVAKQCYPLVKTNFPEAKTIFNTVDLHFLRYERELELLKKFPKYRMSTRSQKVEKEDEIFLVKECDATIVVSDVEAQILRESAPHAKIKAIPLFGEVLGRTKQYNQRVNIGFIGGYQHPPNVDAVKFFVADVWPIVSKHLGNCKFIIAGSNVSDEIKSLESKNIEVRGFIPDLDNFLEEVRVMVAPLRYGAGIKGKIVSSLCRGVPQVVSTEAAEGMRLEHKTDVMIANSAEQFAKHLIDLYTNKELWETISDGAREKADKYYSKRAQSRKISELLDDVNNVGKLSVRQKL